MKVRDRADQGTLSGTRSRSAPRWRRSLTLALTCIVMVSLAACLPPGEPGGPGGPAPGPAADLSQELTGGNGAFIGTAIPVDLAPAGYVQHEYAATGTATSYQAVGGLSADGRWTFQPDTTAPYRTRVLVREPADATRLSGTVVVEWLNVSGGVDADAEWANLHEEIIRAGHIWVGVSAQRLGIEGGQVLVTLPAAGSELAGKGLKVIDPARYGSLNHPGDGFAYDIFTQVARGLRAGAAIGGTQPRKIIAAGQSQSAFAMVTYYNGVQPLTGAFDGFYVHSRGASSLPLVGAGQNAELTSALLAGSTATFRTDQAAPVMDVQAESDLTSILGSAKARQPDSDRFRLWEVAGTAHADAHLLGANAQNVDCGALINDGPLHVVVKAALHALDGWLTTGQPPAAAPRITTDDGLFPSVRRDADGIALGGVRTPPVDVPAVVLSGDPGPKLSPICLLIGSTKPLDASRLAALYPSRADYEQRYAAGIEAAIGAGFVLTDDRGALAAYARPDLVAG
ncbi:hypothetical protein ACG83_14705 [Frankia sp. R43]|uniref:alpha/beta hydrolase domain-containing protein n=1 Tax=Frankia sp. R43 TaxID=269536 RepID=UPI0006CA1316|nr:hypothetical protein ACG83_14705 [Frankia sp. R43]